jgi:hypothetical protein
MPGYHRYIKHLKATILAKRNVEPESTKEESGELTQEETVSLAQPQLAALSTGANQCANECAVHQPLSDSISITEDNELLA